MCFCPIRLFPTIIGFIRNFRHSFWNVGTGVKECSHYYIRNTTCHNYFRTNEALQLKGFPASHIEYRFCDGNLAFIFIDVKGTQHVSSALIRLGKLNPKLQQQLSKNPILTAFDVTRNNVRMIGTVNASRDQLSFVLISKRTANK
jgi:hypothetical protein